ncbi:hypothetical protein ACIQ57_09330 [Lysinibacillus xylanilyticus]|uniref:hypothetical protein n=1 Tax=Lysinibacillus xylanilyticus TaxID=582475 RepID=UPI0037F47435
MNLELKELLRSVLKEELEPVHQRLDGMDKRFESIDYQLVGMNKRFDGIDQRLDKIENDVQGLKQDVKELKSDVEGLKVDVQKLKIGQAELQKNIVENLGEFTEKIAHQAEDRTYVLNRRLFDVETMIHKIDKLDISILLYYRVNPMPIKLRF